MGLKRYFKRRSLYAGFPCLFIALSLSIRIPAQNMLALHVSHWYGHTSRVLIHEGDDFHFRMKNDPAKYNVIIQSIEDTLIRFDNFNMPLKDLAVVYTDESNYVTRMLSKFFIWTGIGFAGLDVFNNLTNGTQPIVRNETLLAGSSLFLTGWILKKAFQKRYRISPRCTVWVIVSS